MNKKVVFLSLILALLVCLLVPSVYFKGKLFPFPSAAGQSQQGDARESDAIRTVVIEYCIAAKSQDKSKIVTLITRTPAYYWDRSAGNQSNNTKMASTEQSELGAKATSSENNDDFADWNYKYLSELEPIASKTLIIPSAADLEIKLNGNYALARTVLKHVKAPGMPSDFLMVKIENEWKIFKVTLPDKNESFPW